MNKKISVIIPCYNTEKTITYCLDSLVNQTIGIDYMELILVDDGSTDGTLDILCQYEQQFPESVLVVHCDENGKPGQARNIGLQYASGDYIGFVDADDLCEPQMYDAMFLAAISQNCDLVVCQYTQKEMDGEENSSHCTMSSCIIEINDMEQRLNYLNEEISYCVWNCLYAKELLTEHSISFPTGIYYEDIVFTGLVNRYCKKICILSDILYHHNLYPSSVTCISEPTITLNYLEANMILIEELRNRKLYQALAAWYDNRFIRSYTLFATLFTKHFGKMSEELFDVLKESIYELYPYFSQIPQVKLFSQETTDLNLRMIIHPLIANAPRNISRILVVKGRSRYDVLRDFADALASGFRNKGVIVDVYDVADTEHRANQDFFCKMQTYDAILSFNGMMTRLLDLFESYAKPVFISFLVDHPYYHHPRIETMSGNEMVCCVDHHHVNYIKQYYPNIQNTFFMAHGGNEPMTPPKPYKERSYSVVFMGSYGDIVATENEINEFPESAKTITWNVIDKHFQNRREPLEITFQREFENQQLDLSAQEFCNLLYQMNIADKYIRLKNRKSIIDVLTDNGVVVDVFGANWEHYSCKHPENLRIHGQVSYSSILETMCNSKLVLNALPLFWDGSHERVFTSMLCGAVCLTERNAYLERQFTDGKELLFYDMENVDALPHIINTILSETDRAEQIALAGQKLTSNKHTWTHRAEEILELIYLTKT